MLLLREVSFELESVTSTSSTGSSSTMGMGRRKEAMPEAGRGRTGVREIARLCKGSISHSEARDLKKEGDASKEGEVEGIYKD